MLYLEEKVLNEKFDKSKNQINTNAYWYGYENCAKPNLK